MQRRTKLLTALITIVGVVAVIGAGCTATPAHSDTPPDPFTLVWGPGGEHVVTFSGDSKGHLPEQESEFILKLNNNSSSTWSGEYLVQLLDRDGIVMDIASEHFKVDPGLGPEFAIPVVFESGLEGPYGLSLIISPIRAQSIQTIWIGDDQHFNVNAGPWPGIGTHPWLWEAQQPGPEEAARKLTWQFVESSQTFTFDGIQGIIETPGPYRIKIRFG